MNQVELMADGTRDPGRDGRYVGVIEVTGGSGNMTMLTIDGANILGPGLIWNPDGPVASACDIVANTNLKRIQER